MLILLLASLVSYAAAQGSCISFAGLAQHNAPCPSGEGIPDCTYIQTNAAAICNSVAPSWDIVNGATCHLKGASYGCQFIDGSTFSSSVTLCCALGSASTATATGSPSPSATLSTTPSPSPSVTATPSSSASATVLPSFSPSVTGSPSSSSSSSPSSSPSVTSSSVSSLSMVASVTPTATRTNTTVHHLINIINTTNTTPISIAASNEMTLTPGISAAIGIAVVGFALIICFVGHRCYFLKTITKERRKSMNVETLDAVVTRRPSLAVRTPRSSV